MSKNFGRQNGEVFVDPKKVLIKLRPRPVVSYANSALSQQHNEVPCDPEKLLKDQEMHEFEVSLDRSPKPENWAPIT